LGLKAAKEHDAVDGALRDCRTRDHDCRVIAIGPFTVEAAEPKPTGMVR
jgi:adenylate cyclase